MSNPYRQEAEKIMKDIEVTDPDVKSWMIGATERLLKQEVELNSLRWTVYLMVFVIFILPFFVR